MNVTVNTTRSIAPPVSSAPMDAREILTKLEELRELNWNNARAAKALFREVCGSQPEACESDCSESPTSLLDIVSGQIEGALKTAYDTNVSLTRLQSALSITDDAPRAS